MSRREKKNWLPLLILTLIFWGLWLGQIIWVDPVVVKDFPVAGGYVSFFISAWGAIFFLMTLLLNNTRRGWLIATGAVLLLVLLMNRLGNIVNTVLLTGLLVGAEFYLANR